MTDIVERLRLSVTKGHEPTDEDAIEAADEIERLREALAKYGDHTYECELKEGKGCSCGYEDALK